MMWLLLDVALAGNRFAVPPATAMPARPSAVEARATRPTHRPTLLNDDPVPGRRHTVSSLLAQGRFPDQVCERTFNGVPAAYARTCAAHWRTPPPVREVVPTPWWAVWRWQAIWG